MLHILSNILKIKSLNVISLILIVIFNSHGLLSQKNNNFVHSEYDNKAVFDSISKNNFNNFPFRFGFELASGKSLNSQSNLQLGFITSIDLNLYDKRYYLKIEYGRFFELGTINLASTYASIGLNYRIWKEGDNRLYLHGAFFAMGNKTGGSASFFISSRYLYALNKFIGLSTSLKYPFGSFKTFMFSIGLQLFTE